MPYVSSREGSSQTSSWLGASRKRQPGGSARYGRISGHHSARCPTCRGSKNPGSSESCSPAHTYHPVVSSVGRWRRPFRGQMPSRTFRATPAFESGGAGTGVTPKRRQTECWRGVTVLSRSVKAKELLHRARPPTEATSLTGGTRGTHGLDGIEGRHPLEINSSR